jgi:hypothetical protein
MGSNPKISIPTSFLVLSLISKIQKNLSTKDCKRYSVLCCDKENENDMLCQRQISTLYDDLSEEERTQKIAITISRELKNPQSTFR